MKSYYRVMLGRKSVFAADCFAGGYIGVDFEIKEDLSKSLPDEWRAFNKKYIPVYLAAHPDKSKVTAGLACGAVWTVCKGMNEGDIALSPDGAGSYRVGEVTGGYYYVPGEPLPHRRRVKWFDLAIARAAMSEALRNSTGSIGTVSNVSTHATEIESFLKTAPPPLTIIAADPTIEDPFAFAMEQHLEAFLVANWDQTEFAKTFSIFEEDGEKVGQQYETDAGPIDVLAISKDRKRLLVVELKRGRATDVVVGQVLRYMGYVKSEIAEADQTVEGGFRREVQPRRQHWFLNRKSGFPFRTPAFCSVSKGQRRLGEKEHRARSGRRGCCTSRQNSGEGAIIALEDDQKLRWALAVIPNVSFYRYEVRFKLVKG